MSRSVRVSIAGFQFSVRTDAKPKYVKQLAAYVEDKIAEAKQSGGKSGTTQNHALLAAMSIADELFQEREKQRSFKREVRERSRRILKTLKREAGAW